MSTSAVWCISVLVVRASWLGVVIACECCVAETSCEFG